MLRVETLSIDKIISDANKKFNGVDIEYAEIRQLEIDNKWIVLSKILLV